VRGVSIKQLAGRTGLSRNTVRAALRASLPPKYQRAPPGSKLDPMPTQQLALGRVDEGKVGERPLARHTRAALALDEEVLAARPRQCCTAMAA